MTVRLAFALLLCTASAAGWVLAAAPAARLAVVLRVVAGVSVSALAGFLGVTLATASAMADRLVRAGHLQSQGSATDRRRIELHLCASGKAVLDRMRHQTQADMARSLLACTPQQLTALVDGLAVLALAFPRTESL